MWSIGELNFGCENERNSRDRKASPAKRIFAPSGSNGQALLRWELPETGPGAIFPAEGSRQLWRESSLRPRLGKRGPRKNKRPRRIVRSGVTADSDQLTPMRS